MSPTALHTDTSSADAQSAPAVKAAAVPTNGNASAAKSSVPAVKGCWATLMTGDSYLPGLAVFSQSLLRSPHASQFPLVVMTVKASCSPATLEAARQLGCRIVEVERLGLEGQAEVELAAERFAEVWTKLRAWTLTEYERVILVDSDMLVRRNMDELFELPLPRGGPLGHGGIAASFACTCNPAKIPTYPDDWIPDNCAFTPQRHPSCLTDIPVPDATSRPTYHLLNSGLVVLSPNSAVYDAMAHDIATSPLVRKYRFPDQDFLAAFFKGSFQPLPYIYNALKKLRIAHPDMWRDDQVKNVHYIQYKPWEKNGRDIGGPDEVTHGWWWTAWEECRAERAGGVDEALWIDCVERYVTDDERK